MTKFQLESDRLFLRPITSEDESLLFSLDSDPEVMRYIGPVKTDREEIRTMIIRLQQYYTLNPGLGIFAAITKQGGEFIGWFELAHLDKTTEIELGYRLLKQHWGKGYATEMSAVLRDYAFNQIGLKRIVGITHPDNGASQCVLQKTGLVYQKEAFHYNLDVKYFALTRLAYSTVIRSEKPADYSAITKINDSAFGQKNEGQLVIDLRTQDVFKSKLSLVADLNGKLIGHILFYPTTITPNNEHTSLILAPLAVDPDYQNQGIGSKLVVVGIEAVREFGYSSINVLGHPKYYPRFGFQKASKWNIRLPFDVPDDAYMVLELQPNALARISGTVTLPAAFEKV